MKRSVGLALICVLVLAACTKTTTTTTASGVGTVQKQAPVNTSSTDVNSWTLPHTLRLTVGEDVENLNPTLTQDIPVSGIIGPLTMAYLVRWGFHNEPVAELVTQIPTQQNGGVSADGLTITYHLRKGVKWSDGAPFDGDDVVWSIHAVLNPANNVVSRTGWDRITKVDEPDKYTVVLHLSKPYSPFLETFFSSAGANPVVMPKHLLAQYPNINNVAV